MAVQVRDKTRRIDRFVVSEKGIYRHLRIPAICRGNRNLHAIARGENDGFADALARFQILQSGRQIIRAKGQAFPHVDRRSLMAHACQQQFHRPSSIAPKRAWAAQVMMEKPTTATVMMAALRPRQPAVVRRNIIAIYVPHVKKEIPIRGSRIQAVRISMTAQVLPAMTARVTRTNPTAIDFEIKSSKVPSAGRR